MLKILLVDDEPLFREGVVQTVDWSACGAGIPDEAINGREALALMAHEAYDYVITDMIMPEMNGLEFLQEATRRFPAVNYIVLSGYDDFLLVKEAFHLGVVDYILKSEFDHQQLMSVIEKQRHIRTQVDSYHTTSGPGDVNLFYMKQGYLRNNWKEYEDIDTVCIQNLGIPLSTDDGLLYTSALRFHFTVETVQREDFRELREQMIHTIDRCVMETSEFLSFDRDGTCYLFYLSSTVLSWRDLSAIWEDMHRRLYAVLEDSVHALSLGFAMHGTTLQHVHSATEEAAYFLSFYHVGGVGKIYSEPKVQTLRKSTACQIPSLLGLVKGL
ncbi:MAG: response regulator, partial [Spirochaetia bacterium]|nr:response regulator [Spirochaetia bacterium]